jgi:hypothetical protein
LLEGGLVKKSKSAPIQSTKKECKYFDKNIYKKKTYIKKLINGINKETTDIAVIEKEVKDLFELYELCKTQTTSAPTYLPVDASQPPGPYQQTLTTSPHYSTLARPTSAVQGSEGSYAHLERHPLPVQLAFSSYTPQEERLPPVPPRRPGPGPGRP